VLACAEHVFLHEHAYPEAVRQCLSQWFWCGLPCAFTRLECPLMKAFHWGHHCWSSVVSSKEVQLVCDMFSLPRTTLKVSDSPEACAKCFHFDPRKEADDSLGAYNLKDKKYLELCLQSGCHDWTFPLSYRCLYSQHRAYYFPTRFIRCMAAAARDMTR